MDHFTAPTRTWFAGTFAAPTEVQARGWPAIAGGAHALLVAPTGSGKTLAAFLWALDRVARLPADAAPGVRVLYVSPLKALVYDVERNLRAPLAGIGRTAQRLGVDARAARVAMRTGDTPAAERRAQARAPADVLVTTPESLFLILGSRAREALRGVHTVIVDEVHAVAGTKRGAHLALSLERLAEIADADPQRIGLSATVRPPEAAARFLGGDRAVAVIDASGTPAIDVSVHVPVPDLDRPDDRAAPVERETPRGGPVPRARRAGDDAPAPAERGIWPAIYPEILDEVRTHRSTIVFVNSRALAERLAQRLNELAGETLVLAHHGSVSHARRAAIEEGLARGEIRGIVATSSLELGIDMGAVDRVLLVESPGSVARGLQRVGRAGHGVGETSAGRVFPKYKGDLLECAAIAMRMRTGEIEALAVPRCPLDVLSQQIVAMCVDADRTPAGIARVARRAAPFTELSDDALRSVLDMLTGHYPSTEMADLRPRLAWDRARDVLSARRGTALVSRTNAGTIPDRGLYAVHAGEDGPRVGELDEEMVFETRAGEVIMLGASSWRVEAIGRDRVIVAPAPGEPGKLPFWRGDGPGRDLELGEAIGALVRTLGAMPRAAAAEWLTANAPLERCAAENLAAYVHDQLTHAGGLPTDRSIVVERFRDELGDWRVCILTPFGARVHAPWAMAIQHALGERGGFEVQVTYTDDGLVVRFADADEPPDLEPLLPDPDEVRERVTAQVGDTAMFASLFRENAVRSLLLTRRRPNERNPLWAQRRKAEQLLATVRRYETFPVVLETCRQILGDVFDLPALERLLRRVRAREIAVHEVETPSASPFARSLVFAYVAAWVYEQDAPLAERRAQALTLDRGLLAELLGHAELRELIDAGALAQVEAEMQALDPERRARDADALHDLLRRLGDLDDAELAARADGDAGAWTGRLERERRAVRVTVAGVPRWIAADDAGAYRDALGAPPPPGLPAAYLAPVDDALVRIARRFARTRGPFTPEAIAARLGVGVARIEPVLRALERDGTLVRGEMRPGGAGAEWCDAEVLRRIKRRTLARLRDAIAPVDARTLGAFLPAWHGIGEIGSESSAPSRSSAPGAAEPGDPTRFESRGASPARLDAAIARIEGLALPWSELARSILPARVPGFSLDALDVLCARGRVVWVGRGALGARDGRVALYRRANARALVEAPACEPPGAAHAAILDHLAARGASFVTEIEDAARARCPGITAADLAATLWDLVWAGAITNDTVAPLRAVGRHGARAGARARRDSTLAGGRWSLVADLAGAETTPTERALARAAMLLERYGVVSREAALAEDLPGGFAPVLDVLRAMEDAGRVRRGWFVEGLSGAQFARAGAVDRLRAVRDRVEGAPDADAARVLAAVDPANPWGALVPWPATAAGDAHRPRRAPGAFAILLGGAPRAWLAPGRRALLTFPDAHAGDDASLDLAFAALARVPRGGRRGALAIERIDGVPVRESPLRERLAAAGFVRDYRGMVLERVV